MVNDISKCTYTVCLKVPVNENDQETWHTMYVKYVPLFEVLPVEVLVPCVELRLSVVGILQVPDS